MGCYSLELTTMGRKLCPCMEMRCRRMEVESGAQGVGDPPILAARGTVDPPIPPKNLSAERGRTVSPSRT